MYLTNEEKETIIIFDRSSDECVINTCDRTVMTKLDKLYKCTKEDSDDEGTYAKEYTTRKQLISFRSDPTYKPEYTPQKK